MTTTYHVAEYASQPRGGFQLVGSEAHHGADLAHQSASDLSATGKTVQITACTGSLTCPCCAWEGAHDDLTTLAEHAAYYAERDAFSEAVSTEPPCRADLPLGSGIGFTVHPDDEGRWCATFTDPRFRERVLPDRWASPADAMISLLDQFPEWARGGLRVLSADEHRSMVTR